MTPEIITYPDRDLLALSLADIIATQLGQHLRSQGHASLCVPGGATPITTFDSLSGAAIDWSNVTVFLGDERWVPGDDKLSNTRLLHRHLLKGPAQAANYIDLYTGAAHPADAAPDLSAQIEPHLPITVALLGMGTDMHTASLFPNAPGLDLALSSDAPLVIPAEGPDKPRITLSARALDTAISAHLLIMGRDKYEALERAMDLDPIEAPIAAFFKHLTVHWAE